VVGAVMMRVHLGEDFSDLQVSSPQAIFSVTPGSARQMRRKRSTERSSAFERVA
jgi:hypothetical protein